MRTLLPQYHQSQEEQFTYSLELSFHISLTLSLDNEHSGELDVLSYYFEQVDNQPLFLQSVGNDDTIDCGSMAGIGARKE